MAFKDLDINEMVGLFSPLVNEAATKQKILSIPELAGMYPQIAKAYEMVLSVRPIEQIDDPELTEISTQQKTVDIRHDRLLRCVAFALDTRRERALAEDPPDEATAAACAEAAAALLPDGTGITNASYRAEAGNAERVERLLAEPQSGATKTLLKNIPVKKGETALDTVALWIQAGAELGKLEGKKAERLAALQVQAAAPQRVIQTARSQWIKVASLLVQAAEVSDAPEPTKAAVIHPLVTAADRAGQRATRRGAARPEAPAAPAAPPAGG
jgi:hypothetical protein